MMRPSDHDLFEHAMAVFDEVCELPRDAHAAALDERCGDDETLRRRVEKMLEHDRTGAGLLGGGMGDGAAVLASSLGGQGEIPARIGRYRILCEIGRGGMGVVYEAEQDQPRRRVALKVIRQGFVSAQVRRRFEREAQVLGQLDHPGIAHIYEAGTATLGNSTWPYFAMEFIEGRSLDAHVRERSLDPRATLELAARVCDAVQHAHQRGIIHRDLKPGNILVKEAATTQDGTAGSTVVDMIGQPKILDFGIARMTDADVQATTMQTGVGQLVGTLAYMSPEQVEARSEDLDTRCDVYAIGVILYTLLAGRPPHDLSGRSIAEAARIVREDEPKRLGAVVPLLRGDVETIVARAMEKDRERRYGSAAELAEDLRRHLRDEPVLAHPPSTFYQARKFARRNKALVGGVAATFVALIAGLVVAGVLLVRVSEERDLAEAATERSQRVAEFQTRLLMRLDVDDLGADIERALSAEYERARSRADPAAMASLPGAPDLDAILEATNSTNLGRAILVETIIERAITLADDYADDPTVEGDIRVGLGDLLREVGRYDAAAEQYALAAERHAVGEGPSAWRAIYAELQLALALISASRYDEAVGLMEDDLLQRSMAVHGTDSETTIRTAIALGRAYRGMGRSDDAVEIQERALGWARAADARGLIATALNELGVLALDAGDSDTALRYFDEYLQIVDESEVGNSSIIRTLNNIMAALFKEGRIAEAEQYARDAIPRFAAEFGDDHPQTIMARNNLARVLLDLGRPEEAEAMLRADHTLALRTLPPRSGIRQAVATNRIDACLDLDQPAEGAAIASALLVDRRGAAKPRAGSIAQTLEQLGLCELARGELAAAAAAFTECIELRESINADHWLTHRARSYLGTVLAREHRFDEAEPLIVGGAEGIERNRAMIAMNMRDREVAAARARVVSLYEGWGRPERAAEWAEPAAVP